MSDTTDLLHISNTLDDINGESIDQTPDYGMNYTYLYIGMSGQKMVDKMNENFHATDSEFLAMAAALGLRIMSRDIKEIKIENNVVYYTTDGTTWKSLQASWGSVVGDINNQTDLANILSDKVGSEAFNSLSGIVSANSSNIAILTQDLSITNDNVSAIYNQINASGGILIRLGAVETSLASKISSAEVTQIRTANSGTSLEFTTDGVHWYPVSSAGIINWGQIDGNIEEQADLILKLTRITDAVSALDEALSNHTARVDNPHGVTKSQVGLGNVDNTSDTDKPVSTAQQQAIAAAESAAKTYADGIGTAANTYADGVASSAESAAKTYADGIGTAANTYTDTSIGAIKFKSLTRVQYEGLQSKDANTFYFINDL